MAKEKDAAEKTLESYNDVFADIVNHELFRQPGLVRAEDLENAVVTSQLKLSRGLTEQERDTAKRWKDGTITLAFLGIENQSQPDSAMPLRVFSYDGAVYKEEVNRREQERREKLPPSPFYPSVTVVLYFGLTRWTGPVTLADCFPNVPEALRPFLPAYRIPVVEVAFLSPEEAAGFESDFRYIADYLVQVRSTGRYVPSDGRIAHVDETLKLMGAITGDRRFQEAVNDLTPGEKEDLRMYSMFDDAIAQGRKLGWEEGLEAGMEQGMEQGMKKGIEKGMKTGIEKGREEASREYEDRLAEKDRIVKMLVERLREVEPGFKLP